MTKFVWINFESDVSFEPFAIVKKNGNLEIFVSAVISISLTKFFFLTFQTSI